MTASAGSREESGLKVKARNRFSLDTIYDVYNRSKSYAEVISEVTKS